MTLTVPTICAAHDLAPSNDSDVCYGELWQCSTCQRFVCWGYGGSDIYPDSCDLCYKTLSCNTDDPASLLVT